MTDYASRSRALIPLAACVSLALVGCGGSEESELPSLHNHYGTNLEEYGRFQQTYTMSDGESERYIVSGRLQVENHEPGIWTGTIFRCERNHEAWCHGTGAMAGTINADRSLSFTVTQERWKDCTALAPGEYAGMAEASTFYATGGTPIRCDDGREGTVTEIINAKAAPPPGYNPI